MRVSIRDAEALRAVTPTALSTYARAAGWSMHERYRKHSDVYVCEGRPDIIIPRTERLGDYASIVAGMIETFAQVAEQDELTIYRLLTTADRDVVSLRVAESDDGSVKLNDGADLIGGARDLLLSVACSLRNPRGVYRAGANHDATDLLKDMRLGQTDRGSFVVTLLTPVIPPAMSASSPASEDLNAPKERQLTRRLAQAANAAREMVERMAVGQRDAVGESVASGVSANLCEALVRIIEPFTTLDVGVTWAQTRPMAAPENTVPFGRADAALLKEAARSLRDRTPRSGVRVYGVIRLLKRDPTTGDGTIHLAADIDGQCRSVSAVLDSEDYERAVLAHGDNALVILSGDLDRLGQRWRLLNPQLENVISDSDTD